MAESLSTKYLDPSLLARLMAQVFVTRLPMEGSISGLHKSPHRGSSVEFAEYRNYAPGDDIRRLDWRVFARTDRFYLKEFEAETNLRCYFVVDASGSMAYGSQPEVRKIDIARRLAAMLAYLLIHQGDAAGLLAVNSKPVADVPPRRTPSHLQSILEALDQTEPKGETGLPAALHELAERIRPRAMVVIISDFFTELEPLLSALQHLRFKKHDVVLFQLLDRAEVDFKFDRPVRFQDMESNFGIVSEPAMIRDEYLRQFNGFLRQLRDRSREIRVDHRSVLTDESLEPTLASFLIERAQFANFA